MKWVTRERPKVDRIACPWLIKRFVDPAAEFLYVAKDEVLSVAERQGATPYDIPNAELGHHGDECSSTRSCASTTWRKRTPRWRDSR